MFISSKKYDELQRKYDNLQEKYDNIKEELDDERRTFSKEIEDLEKLINQLEDRENNNKESIKTFSDDLIEAKTVIEGWIDPSTGYVTDYEGIQLIQEIINKLLQRLDFYYISKETKYPDVNLNLIHTKDNYYKAAREKANTLKEVIESKNK